MLKLSFDRLRSLATRFPEVTATLALVLLSLPIHFTFQADDYVFLRRQFDPGLFDFTGYESQMSRNPLLYILMIPTFKSGLFHYGFLPLYVFFFCYVLGVTLSLRGILRDVGSSPNTALLPATLALVPLLVFNPNQAEVFFFSICATYSVGILAMGCLAYFRSPIVRIFAMAFAFCMLETFFLTALAILWLPQVLQISEKKISFSIEVKKLVKPTMLWLIAGVITFGVRKTLALYFPPFQYSLGLNLEHMLGQFSPIFTMLGMSFFYKTNYVSTVLEQIAIGVLGYSLLSRRLITWKSIAMIFLILLACELHIFILTYSAMRAHFGAIFIRTLILAILLALMWQNESRKRVFRTTITLLFMAYLIQIAVIFKIKEDNHQALQRIESNLVEQMDSCAQPCQITIKELDAGIHRDWVLPPDFWPAYLEWVRYRHRKDLAVQFIIEK